MAWQSPTAGSSPRSTMLRVQLIMSRSISPMVGVGSVELLVMLILWSHLGWVGQPLQLGSQQWPTVGCPPCRVCAISANLGRGVGGWLSDFTGCGTTSWVRVVCEEVWAEVVVSSTGHFLPWAANRDPLGGPSSFHYSCCLTELVLLVRAELVLPVGANWSPPNWREGLPWEPLHL